MNNFEELNPIQNRSQWFKELIPLLAGKEGDIAEFGVFNGGNTKYLLEYGRRVWAFDTFEGLPSEDYTQECDSGNIPGKFKPEVEVLQLLGQHPNFHPIVGRFIDTLPLVPKETKFVACFIDPDYYESHWQIFRFLIDGHLVDGAVLIFDDYDGLEGAKRAINEFCHQEGQTLMENHFIVWEKRNGCS